MQGDLYIILLGHVITGCIVAMLALVLWWFAPRSRRGPYRVWAWAWMAHALYSFSGAIAFTLAIQGSGSVSARSLISVFSQSAAALGALLLLLGTLSRDKGLEVSPRRITQVFILAVLLGTGVVIGVNLGLPTTTRSVFRSLLASVSFLGSSVILLRGKGEKDGPSRLLAIALAGLGLCYVHYLVHGIASLLGHPFSYLLTPLTLLELPWVAAIVATKSAMALVDQRRWADAELHERDARHERILENLITGVYMIRDGRFTYVNRAFATVFGSTPDDLVGTDPLRLVHEDDRQGGPWQATAMPGAKGPGQAREFRGLKRDGAENRVMALGTMVEVDGEQALVGNLVDITAVTSAQEEMERLATAIEQAGEVVVITDAHGRIQYVNPAFEAVTGYRRSEVLGQSPRLLQSGVHGADFYRDLWSTIGSGKRWHGHFVNRRKDGSEFTETATISPVRDKTGTITAYVAVKRDITDEIAAQAALSQSQRLESVGQLAGGIAHDFNNLLSIILGYAEMAMESLREGDPVHEDMDQVLGAATRAKALTQQLLAFSRRQVLEPEAFDLGEVLTELERMLRRLVGEHITMSLHLSDDLGHVFGDPRQVEQVVMNLVVNARDAMPRGGTLVIEASNVENDDQGRPLAPDLPVGSFVEILLADSGHGMDEATLGRIFEPFFTTKSEEHGTGLGLSTVYGIVMQSGGAIRVESEVGRGTTFRVYLPRAEARAARHGTRSEGRRPTGNETILLVEDEEGVRRLTERILRNAGYEVLTAASGGDAMVLWEKRTRPIHLLLSDVVMPHLSGPELASRMRKEQPDLKVLFMSGYTDELLTRFAVGSGHSDVVLKPFTASDLTIRIRSTLDG